MAFLYGNRHDEQYVFKRVSWENFQEHESYSFIKGGSIEYADSSSLKVTGSFPFEGYELPDANDLVRIYYSFRDDNGEKFEDALATFFATYSELIHQDTTKGIKTSGTIRGASVLTVLEENKIGVPITIPKNENAVYAAEQLAKSRGLPVDAEISSFTLATDHTFDAGTSYLSMINWLLEIASFNSAYPDAMGTVIMASKMNTVGRQYREYVQGLFPSSDTFPSSELFPQTQTKMHDGIKFVNDAQSIMYPEIRAKNSYQSTPNVVRLLYNVDDACIIAEARNLSGSRSSLSSRGGRETTHFEEIGDLGIGNRAERLRQLAVEKLMELSCDVEYVNMEHAYIPVSLYDPTQIKYGELEWEGNVDNIQIELSPSTRTQLEIKRTLLQDIIIDSAAQVIR
jgi:hypothetical protein